MSLLPASRGRHDLAVPVPIRNRLALKPHTPLHPNTRTMPLPSHAREAESISLKARPEVLEEHRRGGGERDLRPADVTRNPARLPYLSFSYVEKGLCALPRRTSRHARATSPAAYA